MVVAKLVEWSLQMPEVRGLNPVIGKLFYQTFICLLSTVLKRRNKRKKRPRMAHFNKEDRNDTF